jgi:hypothetical protein
LESLSADRLGAKATRDELCDLAHADKPAQ